MPLPPPPPLPNLNRLPTLLFHLTFLAFHSPHTTSALMFPFNSYKFKPVMGYSTWQQFAHVNATALSTPINCRLTEQDVLAAGDSLIHSGLRSLGYQFVNVDDCWSAWTRANTTQRLQPAPHEFPSGIPYLAQKLHDKQLLFGLYTSRGVWTCQMRPGSQGHEKLDADTMVRWGVDLLKHDSCFASFNRDVAIQQYILMRNELTKACLVHNHSLIYSLCGRESYYAVTRARLGDMFRVGDDVSTWEMVYVTARIVENLGKYVGSHRGWNDMDHLLGSEPGIVARLTPAQSRTQFSIWAIANSPLILSSTLSMQPGTFDLQTYSSKLAIQVNQDTQFPPGQPVNFSSCPPTVVGKSPPIPVVVVDDCAQIWWKRLPAPSSSTVLVALVYVNWGTSERLVICTSPCLHVIGIQSWNHVIQVQDAFTTLSTQAQNSLRKIGGMVLQGGTSRFLLVTGTQ